MTPEQVCDLAYKASEACDNTVDTLSNVMGEVMEWMFTGQVEAITKFYELLDHNRLSLVYLAALLRVSFAHGHQIPTWDDYRLRAINFAKTHFADTYEGAFCGLLEPDESKSGLEGAFDRLIGIHPTFVRD